MGVLDGKVAVVTGGASGIGEATVKLFTNEGARVVLGDILDKKGRMLEEENENIVYVHTDVAREADVKALISKAVGDFGRLDCMFNNAGYGGVSGGIEDISEKGFDDTIAVLLKGVFFGMKHAAPVMKSQSYGSIISTASVAGIKTGSGPHVYSTAKAAVIHLTRSVAVELGEYGVRVNCICPGAIPTSIFGRAYGLSQEDAEKSSEALKELFRDAQPIRRSGLSEDVAKAALWLASDGSSFVTGQAIVVDGGLSLGSTWRQSTDTFTAIRSTIVKKSS